jgi:hypothetical protein
LRRRVDARSGTPGGRVRERHGGPRSAVGRGPAELHEAVAGYLRHQSCGELIFDIITSLGEFERALIAQRVRAGMARAKAQGIHSGDRGRSGRRRWQHKPPSARRGPARKRPSPPD